MKADTCTAIAKNGNPCGATVVADDMCAWHAPSWADRRQEWSRKGGQSRSNQARAKAAIPEAMTSAELAGWLTVVFRKVVTGSLSPGAANAAATVAKAILAANEAGALEQLAERVAELEKLA